MTNTNTNTLPKSLEKYLAGWALLPNWDTALGGKCPSATNIADAIAVMSKPGGKPAVLNQGLRAFALGFRTEGSTDGQRSYGSMSGQPHNNVGKLGDALRSAYKSSRLEIGRDYFVSLAGGRVKVTSVKAGHVHFEVTERFAAPVTPEVTPAKPKVKASKKAKAKKGTLPATGPAIVTDASLAAGDHGLAMVETVTPDHDAAVIGACIDAMTGDYTPDPAIEQAAMDMAGSDDARLAATVTE